MAEDAKPDSSGAGSRAPAAWSRWSLAGFIMESAMKPPSAGSQMAQLRDDIDKGRMGDKVAWPDPAAAPLGTDDEAAGGLPPAETVEDMRRSEKRKPVEPANLKIRHAFLVASVVGAAITAMLILFG